VARLSARDHAVLAAIGEAGYPAGLGVTPGQICRATAGSPDRVWTAQQAGRVARRLADAGYVRITVLPKAVYYRLSGMGHGYLSVDDPAEPTVHVPTLPCGCPADSGCDSFHAAREP